MENKKEANRKKNFKRARNAWNKKAPRGDHLEGWDREGGREMQEGGDMGIYVYV